MGQGLDRVRDEKLYYQRGVVASAGATNTSHNRRREGKGGKEQRVGLATVVVGDRHGSVVGISETIISHIGISIVVGPADEIVIIRGIVTNEVLLLRPLASDLRE